MCRGTEKSKLTWRKQVSEATDRKIQSERCGQSNPHRGGGQSRPIIEKQPCRERRRFRSIKASRKMWTEQFTSRCRWDKKNIYPAKMCPATKWNVSGRKRFPNGRWSLSKRDCHTHCEIIGQAVSPTSRWWTVRPSIGNGTNRDIRKQHTQNRAESWSKCYHRIIRLPVPVYPS